MDTKNAAEHAMDPEAPAERAMDAEAPAERAMDAETLAARAKTLRASADGLRALGRARRVDAIAEVAAVLATAASPQADAPHARSLRAQLAASSRLSVEGVAWGLATTLAALGAAELRALLDDARGEPVALTAAVLAGNVFAAALRPLLLPLAAGVPVLAKTASDDGTLPRAIARALADRDTALAESLGVVSFGRDGGALVAALCAHAESVTVLGSDEAVAAIAAHAPSSATLVGRGHGLGALVVDRDAIDADLQGVAESAALDVAAYDQRGCLSPHVALVAGSDADAERFAVALAEALATREASMPRGRVPEDALAAQLQWRGVAAARGALHDGGAFAVAYEGAAPLRPSPGYRNVGVYHVADVHDARTRLSRLGKHLKAVGVAAREATHGALAGVAPYTCRPGRMQSPPLSARLDGLHPLEGCFKRR